MAFHHHPNHHSHHQSTTASCCCNTFNHHPPLQQPPPSSSSCDPFLIATTVTQLLHRINHLESSFLLLSSSSNSNLNSNLNSDSKTKKKKLSWYLRDAAARVIQSHFRIFLVRRSVTLRQLKDLANVKSTLTRLQSSFSPHVFADYDSLSRTAIDLLLLLDSIQGEDKMIRDSKKSITREIVQFLELIDGVCVKKHQVMIRKIKSTRFVRNEKAGRSVHDRNGGSKGRNVDREKKLFVNLRERVERIGKMSRALEADEDEDEEEEEDDESEEFEQVGGRARTKYGHNNRVDCNKSGRFSDVKKRVCFVEDGKTIRVYNAPREMEEIEDGTKVREEDEDAPSDDGEESTQSNEDVRSGGLKGRNVDSEKKLIANLRERVERIGKMSRALEADEEEEEEDDETEEFDRVRNKHGLNNNKSASFVGGKKRVCFVEDGNTIRVRNAAREMEEMEDGTKVREEEEDAQSDDGEQSTQSSEDERRSRTYDVDGKEFTFPTHEPLKSEHKAEFSTRKPGVKIAG